MVEFILGRLTDWPACVIYVILLFREVIEMTVKTYAIRGLDPGYISRKMNGVIDEHDWPNSNAESVSHADHPLREPPAARPTEA